MEKSTDGRAIGIRRFILDLKERDPAANGMYRYFTFSPRGTGFFILCLCLIDRNTLVVVVAHHVLWPSAPPHISSLFGQPCLPNRAKRYVPVNPARRSFFCVSIIHPLTRLLLQPSAPVCLQLSIFMSNTQQLPTVPATMTAVQA